MAVPRSVDWVPIRTEYVTTKTTYKKLSEKYGVSVNVISGESIKGKWREARKKYLDDCLKKAAGKASTREANRLAKLMCATTSAIDVAVGALNDKQQFNRYIVERREKYAAPVEDADGNPISERQWVEERQFSKIDTKALRDLTGVLKDLTGLMRDYYNIPTPAQAEAQRVASERLELDKRRAAADEPDNTVEVIISGDAEEFAK